MATRDEFRLKKAEQVSYLDRVVAFPLASIRSSEHLTAAQAVMDRLLAQGALDQGESLYLDALSDLVATYEDDQYPITPASDADMLQHLLEAKGISQADLHRETGIPKSTISEVIAGKKSFSRQLVRRLSEFFNIDVSVLTANM